MSIHDKLSAVDLFEQTYGNQEAVLRACDLMTQYVNALSVPLPEVVATGLQTAASYKCGRVGEKELQEAEKAVSSFLKGRSALTNYADPEFALAHAVRAILTCYRDRKFGGGASELLSNCLESTERVGSNEELFGKLLEQIFST